MSSIRNTCGFATIQSDMGEAAAIKTNIRRIWRCLCQTDSRYTDRSNVYIKLPLSNQFQTYMASKSNRNTNDAAIRSMRQIHDAVGIQSIQNITWRCHRINPTNVRRYSTSWTRLVYQYQLFTYVDIEILQDHCLIFRPCNCQELLHRINTIEEEMVTRIMLDGFHNMIWKYCWWMERCIDLITDLYIHIVCH